MFSERLDALIASVQLVLDRRPRTEALSQSVAMLSGAK
jgi:hypothetical protein